MLQQQFRLGCMLHVFKVS